MIPQDHQIMKLENENIALHLPRHCFNQYTYISVPDKTSIEQFYETRNEPISSNVTINETDRIDINCFVDSNPNSNIFINRNGHQISMEMNATHINHSVETAACDDTGVYTCTGYNPFITDKRNVSLSFRIYVLCKYTNTIIINLLMFLKV